MNGYNIDETGEQMERFEELVEERDLKATVCYNPEDCSWTINVGIDMVVMKSNDLFLANALYNIIIQIEQYFE